MTPAADEKNDDPKWGLWIKSMLSLGRHWKTKRAARLLECSLPAVVGHLQYLWWWALEFAPDGDLTRFEIPEIAEAALWPGNADTFVAALVRAQFIDNDGECMTLHNWGKYTGDLIEKRAAHAAYMRARRAAQKAKRESHVNSQRDHGAQSADMDHDRSSGDHDPDHDDHDPSVPGAPPARHKKPVKRDINVNSTSAAREPLEKSRVEKSREEKESIYAPNGAQTNYHPRFLAAWNGYPKRSGKRGSKILAYKLWWKLSAADKDAVDVALPNYRTSHEGKTMPKDMSTWLGPGRHWEEWQTPETPATTGGRNGHQPAGINPADYTDGGKYAHLRNRGPLFDQQNTEADSEGTI